MSREIERTISFGPEMAGERIGWVSTNKLQDQEDGKDSPISVDVVSATVGQDGAWFGHEILTNPDGEKSLPIAVEHGFLAVSAISTVLASKENDWRDEFNLSYLRMSTGVRDSAAKILDRATGFNVPIDAVGISDIDWASSGSELIDLLKQKMNDADYRERYAQLYYWLNGSIARFQEGFDDPFEGFTVGELLLPDASMKKQTVEQLKHATGVANTLGYVAEHDEKMRQRLTVFSDIPKETVPSRFIDNRRYASGGEDVIREHISKLAVRQLVYLPIGFRPTGRTWPYMDASEVNEDKAFGIELAGLMSGNIEPANRELAREIAELRARQDFAQKGVQRFIEIAQSEAA